MRKVIGIGETILDILFRDGQPQAAVPGGIGLQALQRIVGAAVVHHAFQAGIAGRDAVGEGELAALHGLDGDEDGHDLRQRGGVSLGVSVLLAEYPPGVRVHEYGVGGAQLRLLQREGGQAQRGQQKA